MGKTLLRRDGAACSNTVITIRDKTNWDMSSPTCSTMICTIHTHIEDDGWLCATCERPYCRGTYNTSAVLCMYTARTMYTILHRAPRSYGQPYKPTHPTTHRYRTHTHTHHTQRRGCVGGLTFGRSVAILSVTSSVTRLAIDYHSR